MLKCFAAGKHFVYYCQNFVFPELALNWLAQQLMAVLLQQQGAQGRIKARKSNHLFRQVLQPPLVSLLYTQQVTSLCQSSQVTEQLQPVTILACASVTGSNESCPKSLGAAGLAVAEHVICLLEGRCCTSLSGEHREGQRGNFKKSQKPVIYISYILVVQVSQRGGQLREEEASDNSHTRLEILLDRKSLPCVKMRGWALAKCLLSHTKNLKSSQHVEMEHVGSGLLHYLLKINPEHAQFEKICAKICHILQQDFIVFIPQFSHRNHRKSRKAQSLNLSLVSR